MSAERIERERRGRFVKVTYFAVGNKSELYKRYIERGGKPIEKYENTL